MAVAVNGASEAPKAASLCAETLKIRLGEATEEDPGKLDELGAPLGV